MKSREKTPWLTALLLFGLAFFWAAFRVQYASDDAHSSVGPGITTDEVINVAQGVYLNDQLLKHGPGLWFPETGEKVFGAPQFLADHPPLGRIVIGFCEMAFSSFVKAPIDGQYNIPAARCASCLMYATTIALLFIMVHRRYDRGTALVAAVLLLLMPRFVAHGRLASLEATTCLTWLLTLSVPFVSWTKDADKRPPLSFRSMLVAGACWGLLLLSKMQGLLMMPVMGLWALWYFRGRFFLPLLVAGVAGSVVFFAGWPWLWLDPVEHVKEYFLRAGDRMPLQVMYFGHRYEDHEVPFHFPFVMAAISVPVVVLLGAFIRAAKRSFDRAEQFALLSVMVPLIVFAIPGTAVYDGVRLFLIVMPMMAFLAARGIVLLWKQLPSRASQILMGMITTTLVLLPIPAALSPFALVDYGTQIGGTAGAAAVGMETDYWGVGLTDEAWDCIPRGATVMVAPISHQYQLRDLQALHPVVAERELTLVPYYYTPAEKGILLAIHRRADLRPALAELPPGARLLGQVRYGKTPLVSVMDLSEVNWTKVPDWPARHQASVTGLQ